MDTVPITPNLAMLRVNGWQLYVWRDKDSVTLIDTGAPGSGAEILSAVPGIDRIVLTHGHVDHSGSVALLSSLVDSLVDFAASLVNFFAVRHAAVPADRSADPCRRG